MIDLSLAVRNLLRNRRRSLATLIALVIGTAAILLFGGYRTNIRYSMMTAYVRDGGHLQIQNRDFYLYGTGNPASYGIANYRRIIQAIADDKQLSALMAVVTPRLQFGGIAGNSSAGVSRTVLGNGVVPADVNRMRRWNELGLPLQAPRLALEGAGPDAAIVGTGVARVLQLCAPLKVPDCPLPTQPTQPAPDKADEALPADIAALAQQSGPASIATATAPVSGVKVDLLATTAGGAPNVVSLNVIRAELQGFKELDEIYLIMPLEQAQRLVYGRAPPQVTAIMIQLVHTAQLENAKAALTALLARVAPGAPLTVMDYRQLNPYFVQTVQMFDTIFGFIFVLIGAIVLFTVSNTMSTAVMERTVEIGTIRTLGLRQSGVQRLFVLEGALLGTAGAVGGTLFALTVSGVMNHLGLTWLPPGSGGQLPLVLIVWGETPMIVGTMLGIMTIATLSAWWPAYRASRVVIVEALRHV